MSFKSRRASPAYAQWRSADEVHAVYNSLLRTGSARKLTGFAQQNPDGSCFMDDART